jgi:hypothetical protein
MVAMVLALSMAAAAQSEPTALAASVDTHRSQSAAVRSATVQATSPAPLLTLAQAVERARTARM